MSNNRFLQIIAMSATVSNTNILQKFLDATYFHTSFRPIPLQEYIVFQDQILTKTGESRGILAPCSASKQNICDYAVASIIEESLSNFEQTIIFCGSKYSCVQTLKPLLSFFKNLSCDSNIMEERKKLQVSLRQTSADDFLGNLVDETLIEFVEFGLAYHHAGN